MGGFKPVDLKYLLKPVYELFLHLFSSLFEKTQKNQEFLDLTQKCYQANKVKEFCKCLLHGLGSIKKKNSV
jgi:midasin (ATPase involved in ribosome maturation)